MSDARDVNGYRVTTPVPQGRVRALDGRPGYSASVFLNGVPQHEVGGATPEEATAAGEAWVRKQTKPDPIPEAATLVIPWPAVAPLGVTLTAEGLKAAWDAVVPSFANGGPQSIEERSIMAVLRAVYDGMHGVLPEATAPENPMAPPAVQKALAAAEVEAFEWATGKRSTINAMFGAEHYVEEPNALGTGTVNSPDRQLSFVRIAEADAAEIRAARERVLTLRALAGLTPEGDDPVNVERRAAAR